MGKRSFQSLDIAVGLEKETLDLKTWVDRTRKYKETLISNLGRWDPQVQGDSETLPTNVPISPLFQEKSSF